MNSEAAIAQLGERETEDLKVPSSILGLGSKPSAPRTAGRIRDDTHDAREGPVAFLCRVSACADGVCFTLAFEPSWFLTGNATSTYITARGRTRIYTWPGSNWRPSACWADVIATRPQVHIFLRAALFFRALRAYVASVPTVEVFHPQCVYRPNFIAPVV